MSRSGVRCPTIRSANAVNANPQRMDAADKVRSATGRNVKGESPRGRGYYDIFEVWALKERRGGRVVTVATHRTREDAAAWIAGEKKV